MRKTIRFKLFLTFLIITLLIVSSMHFFMRWSLHQGFTQFIEARQQERISNLLETLTEYYGKTHSWEALAEDKQNWIKLLLQANPHSNRRPPPWLKPNLEEANNVWPPTIKEERELRIFTPLELRVMLLNADKRIIYGRQELLPQLKLYPISEQENIVGYLGLTPSKGIQIHETLFLEKQTESFVLIAAVMICLSAGLAALLAYLLGRPLKRLTNAAKALAVGRYDVRLPVDSCDELGLLARDFNEMAAALEQSELARRRWVADISHELRTPLAILRAELEALQDGIRPLTPAAIDSLFGDVMRLNRLTEDLYQLSLSDQGALSYRKTQVDVVAILKDDMDALQPTFQAKNIQITWQNQLTEPLQIYADPDRLSQLFRNLLANSANYTDQSGQLIVSVSRDHSHLLLNFSDSAPGVEASALPKLFDRFYRVDHPLNSNHGGAGLGLAICNNIVNAHNGKIAAQSSALDGLSITIEFPLS